jgi:hypothetical protein
MKTVYINEPRHDKERTICATVIAVVIAGAMVVTYLVSESQWGEGYTIGYDEACADVRATVASRLEQEKPFFLTNLGMSFHRVGDHTFYIHFTENKGRPAAAALTAQGHRSGQ